MWKCWPWCVWHVLARSIDPLVKEFSVWGLVIISCVSLWLSLSLHCWQCCEQFGAVITYFDALVIIVLFDLQLLVCRSTVAQLLLETSTETVNLIWSQITGRRRTWPRRTRCMTPTAAPPSSTAASPTTGAAQTAAPQPGGRRASAARGAHPAPVLPALAPGFYPQTVITTLQHGSLQSERFCHFTSVTPTRDCVELPL